MADTAVCCFDLEEVFLTPHSFESCLFYKRRLNTFNFTVYNFGTRDGYCFVWNEAIVSRGACDIASCLLSYLEEMPRRGKKRVIMYSDNHTGQNKNRYLVTMLWYALQHNKLTLYQYAKSILRKGILLVKVNLYILQLRVPVNIAKFTPRPSGLQQLELPGLVSLTL